MGPMTSSWDCFSLESNHRPSDSEADRTWFHRIRSSWFKIRCEAWTWLQLRRTFISVSGAKNKLQIQKRKISKKEELRLRVCVSVQMGARERAREIWCVWERDCVCICGNAFVWDILECVCVCDREREREKGASTVTNLYVWESLWCH